MEKMVTEEDMVRNRAFIERAKMLFPNHESVITLEAEQVSSDGNVEEALRVLDKASQNGNNATNISLILARASVLTSKAFMDMQNPGAMLMVQATLGDVQELYKKALEIEPNAIEVMAQFAQLKSMVLGDLDNAVAMLKQALPLARSRDEVQELCQLLAMNEAQLNAINFMKEQSD